MPTTTGETDLAAIRRIWPEGAWPCFSPDGGRLVFTGHLDRRANCLMILRLPGGDPPTVVTPAELNANRPTWLSTGDEIAFNCNQKSIWTVHLESGRLAPFLSAEPPGAPAYFHPCAYPNERAVVVVSFKETSAGRAGELYKLTPAAAEPVQQLTAFPEVCAGRPAVSPDGKTVAFAGNAGRFAQGANQLWIVRPPEKPRRLEEGDPALVQGRGPRWSPDGKWIACTSTRPTRDPNETTPRAIWIVRADGSQSHCVTDRAFNPLHVAWSPDQKQLVCGGPGCGLGLVELPERFHSACGDSPKAGLDG